MKKTLLLTVLFLGLTSCFFAQNVRKDSVVQFYGLVMIEDSFTALPFTRVAINGENRGTYTNNQGVFSLVVKIGDKVSFTYPGFLNREVTIPDNLSSKEFSVVQVMSYDTVYLPAVVIKARLSPEEFERDFVNLELEETTTSLARKNMMMSYDIIKNLAPSAKESVNSYLQQNSNSYYTKGQMPGLSVLNPAAWMNFIKGLKSGAFKRKKSKY